MKIVTGTEEMNIIILQIGCRLKVNPLEFALLAYSGRSFAIFVKIAAKVASDSLFTICRLRGRISDSNKTPKLRNLM